MKPPGSFETISLRLRAPSLEDAPALFDAYASKPEATKFLSWRTCESAEEIEAFLRQASRRQDEGSEYFWVIEEKATSDPIGMISVGIEGTSAHLGYVLSPTHWGRGYMTEAAGELTRWFIGRPEIYRVWAVCDVEHPASARVLEKCGMQREGVLRKWLVLPNLSEFPRDVYCYSIV